MPIQRKTYSLLGDDPFYEIGDEGCFYFTNVVGEWVGAAVSGDHDYLYISVTQS